MTTQMLDYRLKYINQIQDGQEILSGSYKHPLSPEKLPSQNCMFQPQFNKIR